MAIKLPKIVYYEDEDFCLEYQKSGDVVNLHCVVHNWNFSSLKRGYVVFGKMMNEFSQQGITSMITVTPNPKFAKLFGGTTVETIEQDNKKYEVIVWEL